jgi:crotonobetainyl-CoA:carnitine CoA-transferase CaiB-like acyl-CoA transferase
VAPVLSIAEAARDEQFAARGAIVEAMHPVAGSFRQVAPVLAGMPPVTEPVALPDLRGTATETALLAAGVDKATVREWQDKGAVA